MCPRASGRCKGKDEAASTEFREDAELSTQDPAVAGQAHVRSMANDGGRAFSPAGPGPVEAGEGDEAEGGEADAGTVPGALPPGTEDDDEGGDEDELAEFDAEVEPKEGGEGIPADVFRLHKAVGKGEAVNAAEEQDHEGPPALKTGGVKAFES